MGARRPRDGARVVASAFVLATVALGAGPASAQEATIHELAATDKVAQIARAIEDGVPVDARDREGRTALHVAAENAHLFVAMMLIAKGANPNARDRRQRTPLHVAADGEVRKEGERFQIVKLLVAKGGNRSARDADGMRPVDYAKTKEFRAALTP